MISVVLVHGAGSGPWIYDGWRQHLEGWHIETPDLQEGLDVARASMDDYATKIVTACAAMSRPRVLCGWSMGGLVVAMAAQRCEVDAVVLIESSPPSEVQGANPTVVASDGAFDAEGVYGAFPPGIEARAESQRARDDRKRGISVPALPPTLVVYGDEFKHERGEAIANHYGCETLYFAGLDHWGLILDERVPVAVADWIRRAAPPPRSRPSNARPGDR